MKSTTPSLDDPDELLRRLSAQSTSPDPGIEDFFADVASGPDSSGPLPRRTQLFTGTSTSAGGARRLHLSVILLPQNHF